MKRLFISFLVGFSWIAPATAEDKKVDEGYYKLDIYSHHRHFAVMKDPREGICHLRFMNPADTSLNKVFTLTTFQVDGEPGLGLTIMSRSETFDELTDNDQIALAVDRNSAVGADYTFMSEDNHNYYVRFKVEDIGRFKRQFKEGETLLINVPGIYIGEISLRGSTRAVNSLKECNKEMTRAADLRVFEKPRP